ncbi:MAG TPA: hypothetical protein VNF74_11390 [Terriglobales bacterium]|nr:hypothetical protein [Terriglobales bacterium]
MRRDDIQGRRAPRWLQAILTRRYGRTPFGEPRYRLVWAPARRERSGGVWTDWDASVGKMDRQKAQAQPLRRVAEMRWAPKYPGEECWLIERWIPASSFGTPEQWYRPAAEGGTVVATAEGAIAACGDYPRLGDYEDIGARMYWYPTERHLTLAVDAVERSRAALPASALGRALRRSYQAAREQEKRDAEFDRAADEVFDDSSPAFGGAPMIGYGGSHRPALVEMAERMGIRQHPL